MKKYISSLTIIFIITYSLTAQDKTEAKSFIRFGYGYYMDMFMAFDDLKPDPYTGLTPNNIPTGTALWIEGGHKLPNGIIVK